MKARPTIFAIQLARETTCSRGLIKFHCPLVHVFICLFSFFLGQSLCVPVGRVAFEAILYYYQSYGKLRRPQTVPLDVFLEEVRFYELGDYAIDKLKADEGYAPKEEDKPLPKHPVLKSIWLLFEDPGSSIGARYVAIISVLVIVGSIVIFCIETLPQFKHYKVYVTPDNKTKIVEDDDPSPSDPFFIIECLCITWFCLEFLLRFIACPSKVAFIKVSCCCSFIRTLIFDLRFRSSLWHPM